MFNLPTVTFEGNVGASTSNLYTIVRQGSMRGDITLSATSVPSGFNVTFEPSTLLGSAVNTRVDVAVARSVSRGAYVISLQGQSASQVQTIKATINVGEFTTAASQ
ncbi:hypothetical protein Q0M94_23600 (plasmid) [Deinococcus radiomollis]|uniref:hypothetical protein n=1 Tax=Deinococcus radiomollis TaxID=468916 RepID=UPI003891EB94